MSKEAIRHRIRCGRLHRLWRGVYAVDRTEIPQQAWWMAATLACGPQSVLSHRSAAALWGLAAARPGPIHVAVPLSAAPQRPRIHVHRKRALGAEDGAASIRRRVDNVPVTEPVTTLIDLAAEVTRAALEAAVNEASQLDLVNPEQLRSALDSQQPRPGSGRLKRLLDRDTFVLTHTELERRFLRIVRESGLPMPAGQVRLGSARVDFHWAQLGLVVECDSLRYHRTAAKQAADLRRDQEHMRAGRHTLRVNHHQVRYEPRYVRDLLAEVAGWLAAARDR